MENYRKQVFDTGKLIAPCPVLKLSFTFIPCF